MYSNKKISQMGGSKSWIDGLKKQKKAFNQALFTLLDQKTFQQITITDIVTEADVNRGTFYKHYRDKEELLDSIIEEILMDLKKCLSRSLFTYKSFFYSNTYTINDKNI